LDSRVPPSAKEYPNLSIISVPKGCYTVRGRYSKKPSLLLHENVRRKLGDHEAGYIAMYEMVIGQW
jgi:hypothetical protein